MIRCKATTRKCLLLKPLQGTMNQHLRPEPIPFIDLAAQRRRLGKSVDEAVSRVLDHCQFINGPEVAQLEGGVAVYSGARHVVTVRSGTDATADGADGRRASAVAMRCSVRRLRFARRR